MTLRSFTLFMILLAPMHSRVWADDVKPTLTLYHQDKTCTKSTASGGLYPGLCLFGPGQPVAVQSVRIHPRDGGPGCLLAYLDGHDCTGKAIEFNVEFLKDVGECHNFRLDPTLFSSDGIAYQYTEEPCVNGRNFSAEVDEEVVSDWE